MYYSSEEDDSDEESTADSQSQEEYPMGTKLRVKYGRGRNHKIYEAKVVESRKDGTHKSYLVHYAGWNTRYDEWVRPDRIVAIVNKPEVAKLQKKAPVSKSPKGAASPKSETPQLKKRGRQPSVQQVPSPSAAKTASPAGDAKTPKSKAPTTPSGSASKTRSMRSNSTEIKAPEAAPVPTKHRITRRSSGLNDTVEAPSPADQDAASESEVESEPAPPSASGGDLSMEREEEEDLKTESSMEHDISMEEGAEPLQPPEPEPEQKPASDKREKDSSRKKDQTPVEEFMEVDRSMPDIVPKETDHEVSVALPGPAVEAKSSPAPSAVEKTEPLMETVKEEFVKFVEPVLMKVVVEQKQESVLQKAEEAPVEVVKAKDDAPVQEGNLWKVEADAEPRPESSTPNTEKSEEEKELHLEEPTIPELKKIEIDVIPEEKRDLKEKEKFKTGKKAAKEARKGRQSESRLSLSEIPTLEPMTTPSEVRPKVAEVAPSPYDFTESELDSPWQPEITKKWEPNNKTPPLFRDAKQELKKSLESEKKKVKKKVKKAEESSEVEKPEAADLTPKPADEDKAKDSSLEPQTDKPPAKKKGRKKKEGSGDMQKDISTYEETVNSVVESCRLSAESSVPSPVLEEKKEKVVKKRKNKSLEGAVAAVEAKDNGDSARKESLKKGVKGNKGKKKLKEGRQGEDAVSEPSEAMPLPCLPLTTQETDAGSQRREKPSVSQSPDLSAAKQARLDPGVPSVSNAAVPASAAAGPNVTPPSIVVASSVSVRQEPGTSTSTSAGLGPSVSAPVEVPSSSARFHQGLEAHADFAVSVPQSGVGVVNTVLDNTPPTTPENDLDEANSGSSSDAHDNLKDDLESLDSVDRTSKVGSESPSGCDYSLSSASSENLPASKAGPVVVKPSEPEPAPAKRKRVVSEDPGVSRKKRRLNSRGCRVDRNKKSPRYGEDDNQGHSVIDLVLAADLHTSRVNNACKMDLPKSETPRPPKFHFTDDLGQHLAGEQRISFLMSKMMEIRKEYSRIKSEIAAIDRKRKRARRREKEKESCQTSQDDHREES